MLKIFRKKGQKGFTLIELMIVIAIIGILAAIAIPQFLQYRQRAYDASSSTDIKNMYTAAQAYFVDHPSVDLTITDIKNSGYNPSTGVTPTVVTGTMTGLSMTASHSQGKYTYTVDANGQITH